MNDGTSLQQSVSSQNARQIRVQVRLLDGSTIRSSFSPDQNIQHDVRHWIDQEKSNRNTPYTLKHVLTPLPNRTIAMSEEAEALKLLGLGPSATLVMVPVQSFTDAYASSTPGLVSRGIYGSYDLLQNGVSTLWGALGTFVGASINSENTNTVTPSGGDPEDRTSSRPTHGSNRRIRTLGDQREDSDSQRLYNGNQVGPVDRVYIELQCS